MVQLIRTPVRNVMQHCGTMKLYIVILLQVSVCINCRTYDRSPGVIKAEVGTSVSFRWTLTSTFDTELPGNTVQIHHGFYENLILSYEAGGIGDRCNKHGNDRHTCITEGMKVGFSVAGTGIVNADAGRYICGVILTGFGSVQLDRNAILYIYKAPTKPVLSGDSALSEGQSMTVSCLSSSLSLPDSHRNLSVIEYSWTSNMSSGNYNPSGNSVVIGPVERRDDGASVTCTTWDQGSVHTSVTTISISVHFAPGTPQVTVNKPTVTEDTDDLVLTCSFLAGEDGNPASDKFNWKNLDTSHEPSHKGSVLTITKSQLNATLHEGRWQCTPQNSEGLGSPSQVSAIVNAAPSVVTAPGSHSVNVNDNLNMVCRFRAKPRSTIEWRYRGTGSPPENAVIITPSENTEGKHTVTVSTISWLSASSFDARANANGSYTCRANNGVGSGPVESSGTLDVLYGPLSINLGPGNPAAVVIENEQIDRTCYARCNPSCDNSNIFWTNSSSGVQVGTGADLHFNPATRYDDGAYVCTANNNIWANSTQFVLTVHYIPDIQIKIMNEASLVQGDSTTMTCTVDSKPESTITMRNMTADSVLDTEDSTNMAVYSINILDCLHSGPYRCRAGNDVPSDGHVVDTTVNMEVMCPPRLSFQKPSSGYSGAAIGQNHLLEAGLISNPPPEITRSSWTFTAANVTRAGELPPNVAISEGQSNNRLTVVPQLNISDTTLDNYGTYTLTASNGYGTSQPIQFILTPQGPPAKPSIPYLMSSTAVSLSMNWTAGFNGGYNQTFTVMYTTQGSSQELAAAVDHPLGVNRGDVVNFKLKDPDAVLPATTYSIRIRATNGYNGGSEVYGDPHTFKTKEQPKILSDPQVNFDSTKVTIILTIEPVESVSHIVSKVCPEGETVPCSEENTTVTSPDVRIIVQLPDATALQEKAAAGAYDIRLAMYDGADEVNSWETVESVPGSGNGQNIAAIAGGIAGGMLALLAVVFIVLWRKGILPKKEKESERMPMQSLDDEQQNKPPGVENPGVNGASVYSMAGEIQPYASHSNARANAIVANDIEINPYGTSNDVQVSSSQIQIESTSSADPTQPDGVGPLNGDIYSQVQKGKKPDVPPGKPVKPGIEKRSSHGTTSQNPNRPVSVYPPAKIPLQPGDVYAVVQKKPKVASESATPPVQARPEQAGLDSAAGASPAVASAVDSASADGGRVDGNPKDKKAKKASKFPFFKTKDKKGATPAGQPYENVDMKDQEPVPKAKRSNGDGPYVNVMGGQAPEGAYSEVRVGGMVPPSNEVAYQNYDGPAGDNPYANVDAHGNRKPREFQRVGVDGTLYAELEHMRAEQAAQAKQQPVVIHGAENKTEYASIDYNKLKKRKT